MPGFNMSLINEKVGADGVTMNEIKQIVDVIASFGEAQELPDDSTVAEDAPSAPAVAGAPLCPTTTQTAPTLGDELRDLKKLQEEGILTQAEFEAQKKKLLAK